MATRSNERETLEASTFAVFLLTRLAPRSLRFYSSLSHLIFLVCVYYRACRLQVAN